MSNLFILDIYDAVVQIKIILADGERGREGEREREGGRERERKERKIFCCFSKSFWRKLICFLCTQKIERVDPCDKEVTFFEEILKTAFPALALIILRRNSKSHF